MNRGFYHSVNGMILNQRILNNIASNISNVRTSGFKADKVVTNTFQKELILVQNRQATSGAFHQNYVESKVTDLSQGSFEFTASPFDVALRGNVYFNIRGFNGNMYLTRNGQFGLDDEGYLVQGSSGRIQGANGDIYIGNDDFAIDNEGNINGSNGFVDRLLITYVPSDAQVTKFGVNMFTYAGDGTIPEDEAYAVIQGAYERSNVDLNYETLRTVEVQRLFEANSSILKQIDAINASVAQLSKI